MTMKALACGGLLAIAIPAFGHHSFAMFELTKDVTYEGTVLEYRWENPHTDIIVKVDPGTADRQRLERGISKAALPISWAGRVGREPPSNRAIMSRW
jgi:hypothetical protein